MKRSSFPSPHHDFSAAKLQSVEFQERHSFRASFACWNGLDWSPMWGQRHANARTQQVFLQTGFVGAYSIIFNQLAVTIISSTIHEINPFSWLNLSDVHVSPCQLFPTKLDFAPFFPALSQGPRTTWVWPYAYHANEQYWSQCVRWTFQWSQGAGWPGWSKATVCTVPNF